MRPLRYQLGLLALLGGAAVGPNLQASLPDAAEHSIQQFLAHGDSLHSYRATRRLEAENRSQSAWMEAVTEYSPQHGFRYEVTTEGGSGYIRSNVLRAVLEGERDIIAQGEIARAALALENYTFESNGVDAEGLANIRVSPRRKERVLLTGTLFLEPDGGGLVRVQGRLAKSPSFWVKHVDIVRSYERIDGTIVPVALESRAQVRLLGPAMLHMTYRYVEINGRPVASTPSPPRSRSLTTN